MSAGEASSDSRRSAGSPGAAWISRKTSSEIKHDNGDRRRDPAEQVSKHRLNSNAYERRGNDRLPDAETII